MRRSIAASTSTRCSNNCASCTRSARATCLPHGSANASKPAETDSGQDVVERDAQPPVEMEEEQQPERDENGSAHALDHDVVISQPPKNRHRAGKSDSGEQEGKAESRRVGHEQDR